MAAAQVNARIDSALKESGDRALSSIGYTPTKAVRVLWEFCSKTAHDKKALKAAFEMLAGACTADAPAEGQPQSEARLRMEHVKEGPRIFERALQEMGVSDLTPSGFSDEELLEQAYRDKWAERGLT